MENSNNTGKILGALLIGAAIGGTMGVLFAPDKGSKTRKKILDQGEDLTQALTDKFNDFLDDIKKELDRVKDKSNEYAHNGKS